MDCGGENDFIVFGGGFCGCCGHLGEKFRSLLKLVGCGGKDWVVFWGEVRGRVGKKGVFFLGEDLFLFALLKLGGGAKGEEDRRRGVVFFFDARVRMFLLFSFSAVASNCMNKPFLA